MNRYLLRSLIALSTFLLSIAVSAVIHPFGFSHSNHRDKRGQMYVFRERSCRRDMAFRTPSLSIDTAASDPVKLVYSETRPLPNSSNQQVILLLDNQTARAISTAVVKYSSQWPAAAGDENGSPRVSYYSSAVTSGSRDLETVSIECGSDETIFLWLSSIEFKDGSRWINPRHGNEQSF
jgi:hypothetical protein